MSTVTGGQGNIVTSGLVLNLDAANPRSYAPPYNGVTWTTLAGSNNGTLTNGPTFNSSNGGSIAFDGSNDYIQVIDGYTATMKNNNNWSVSLWFKANNLSNSPVLISPEAGQLNYYDLFLEIGSNVIYFAAGGGGYIYSNVTLTTNIIYNVVFIKTGVTTGKIYLNGNETTILTSGAGLGAMPNTNADFRIGAFKNTGYFLNGNIYNIIMYNRSLSAQEVLQNYNATRARFGV